jgi:dynein heavy chain, axonemal
MFATLPIFHFEPAAHYRSPSNAYQCPLYRTPQRAGVLSSTGQSTNLVLRMALPVPAGTQPTDWMLQGATALCTNRA